MIFAENSSEFTRLVFEAIVTVEKSVESSLERIPAKKPNGNTANLQKLETTTVMLSVNDVSVKKKPWQIILQKS